MLTKTLISSTCTVVHWGCKHNLGVLQSTLSTHIDDNTGNYDGILILLHTNTPYILQGIYVHKPLMYQSRLFTIDTAISGVYNRFGTTSIIALYHIVPYAVPSYVYRWQIYITGPI